MMIGMMTRWHEKTNKRTTEGRRADSLTLIHSTHHGTGRAQGTSSKVNISKSLQPRQQQQLQNLARLQFTSERGKKTHGPVVAEEASERNQLCSRSG